jgi:hypothetical protein
MPPTYNTIKNENIQSKTTIKETTGITKGFKEIEENQEDCGLFLKDSNEAQNMPKTADHVELEYDFG